jgi:hypothetical protein
VTLLEAWVVFPLVCGGLSLGLGRLVEAVSGTRLPPALLLPVGSAVIVAVTSFAVGIVPSAALITALVAALAAFGLALGGIRRIDNAALGAAGGVFLCFGAPVLASRTATFAGYIKLDDTATFLSLADRALEHGRSLAGLAPSSYEATLAVSLAHGYPLGSVLPLAVGHELVRLDVAWLHQPWIAWNAAMLALCLYQLAAPVISSRLVRALVVFAAAQPALLYGFALWGGVKELAAAALLATAVALAQELKPSTELGTLVPLAIVCAALLDVLSVAAVVWLVPLGVAVVLFSRRRPRAALTGLATAAALSIPAVAAAADFYVRSSLRGLTDPDELGNLVRPLRGIQVLGIWPTGDFRVDPDARALTAVVLVLATLAGVVGIRLAAKQKAHGLLLALASAAFGAIVFVAIGAPWIGAKALAVASPFVLLAVLAGAIAVVRGRNAVVFAATAAVSIVLLCSVAWSNALAYHDVSLAPFDQMRELGEIGTRFADRGPTLLTEYQPYGVRHFLRRMNAEGASELRRRAVALRDGRTASKGEYIDVDRIRLPDLLIYRTLVLRRSPTASRPPAPYRRVWEGRWYTVWEREGGVSVVEHRPLGNELEPGGPAACRLLGQLASTGRVALYPRPLNRVWPLSAGRLPPGWSALPGGAILPDRTGTLTLVIGVPATAPYRLWIGGSIRGSLSIAVRGSHIGTVTRQLQNAGQWLELGTVKIPQGPQSVTVTVSLPKLSPGTGGRGFPLGPLLLEPVMPSGLVELSAPQTACGTNVDWIEVVAAAG